VGMRLMKFAERTDSVVAQKFFRIEHAPQQTFHPMSAGERNETQFFHARLLPTRDQRRQVGSILEIPLQSRFESRQRFDQLPLNRFNREQRHQTDERADAQRKISSARRVENVVVEFVLLVPQTDAFAAEFVHRGGNAQEMLEKFRRDIFVNVIFARELDRDSHQIQAKHSHPTGAVALLEMGAVGKLRIAIEYANVVETEKATLKNILSLGVFAVYPPGERDQHFV